MSDRLLSDDELHEIYAEALDKFRGHLGFMQAIRDAQDHKSYPLGEEAGIAKGRAEVVAFIDKEYSWIIPREQLKEWGLG